MRNKKVIGVTGGAGAMGSHMASIFQRHDYEVLIHDIDEKKANKIAEKEGFTVTNPEDMIKNSDIWMVSVPIPETLDVIRKYGNLVKPNSLATDVTSRKVKVVEAFKESTNKDVEIISLHPMYRPTVSPEGQRFIEIPVRPAGGGLWSNEIENILYDEKAFVKKIDSPEKHDLFMDIIQGLAHTKHMVSADATMKILTKYGIPLEEFSEFSSAFYEKTFELDGRIVDGNPDLYIPIQTQSEGLPEVIEVFEKSLSEHKERVAKKDSLGFKRVYNDWKEFYGPFAKEASKATDKTIGKPVGLEIFYKPEDIEDIESKLLTSIDAQHYKAFLSHSWINEGRLSRLKPHYLLTKKTLFTVKEYMKDGEGATVFFTKKVNMLNRQKKKILFSPINTDNPLKRPDIERIQMFNRFTDPYLNLFDTYDRIPALHQYGKLVAYTP